MVRSVLGRKLILHLVMPYFQEYRPHTDAKGLCRKLLGNLSLLDLTSEIRINTRFPEMGVTVQLDHFQLKSRYRSMEKPQTEFIRVKVTHYRSSDNFPGREKAAILLS